MIGLLVAIIIFCIVGGLIYSLILLLPLPTPFKTWLQVAVILLGVVILLTYLTGYLPMPYHHQICC